MTQNQTQELPPKTCSIERLVTKQVDVDRVIKGEKTATRRNGRYADIGETMTLDGHNYEVHQVYQQALGELTDEHAKSEGFDNVEAYKQNILAMHPGMPWLPHMKVWVHEFRPVKL
jgi:hypothetical protein